MPVIRPDGWVHEDSRNSPLPREVKEAVCDAIRTRDGGTVLVVTYDELLDHVDAVLCGRSADWLIELMDALNLSLPEGADWATEEGRAKIRCRISSRLVLDLKNNGTVRIAGLAA